MPMAAVVEPAASPADMAPPVQPPVMVTDAFAKDAIISWFRGEFAAANAIIDALCGHLAQLGGGAEYGAVFTAVHRRRMNWIPVLQMQKYHSIADVALEISRVTTEKKKKKKLGEEETPAAAAAAGEEEGEKSCDVAAAEKVEKEVKSCLDDEKKEESNGSVNGEVIDEEEDDSPNSDITDTGSHEMHPVADIIELCSNHEECGSRSSQIILTKRFSAKEPVKGHMVNVVKGLKMFDNVFTESELSKLHNYVNELRSAGQNGELSGETYILFNKQIKGNKRELLQFGVPIFGHVQDDATENGNIQPIPALLQAVIDHLVQWQLLPVYKTPNSCIINFFDEDEYSQPFYKPPHLDQPISTLFLSESTMVFGRFLVSDGDGNYKGPLVLSVQQGSLLVMRGNSADMARHVVCPSPSKRIAISFFRVRPDSNPTHPASPLSGAMNPWQPAISSPYSLPNGVLTGYEGMEIVPKWGLVPAPLVMLAPVAPMVLSPKTMQPGGTGVFLPWNGASRKPAKHLPPRAQKNRLHAMHPPVVESASV